MNKQVNFQGKSVTINGKLQVNGPVNSAQNSQVLAMLEAQVGKSQSAIGDSLQIMQRISDMASDNVIMPEEKRELKREWDVITAEYSDVLAQATDGSSEETAYMAKYAALLLYLYGIGGTNDHPLFTDLTVKSEWTGIGDEVRLVFQEYYVAREAVALGGKRAAVAPSGAKPDSITDIFPIATRDTIIITWSWTGTGLHNKIARHLIDVSYDEGSTWTRFVGSGNPMFVYSFDRAVDGYPEKTTVTTPGPVPLSKYRFRVRPENIYGYQSTNYGGTSTGKIVDVTEYGSWIPPVPVIVPYCNGREAVINWNDGKQYGKLGYDVQICKKDTTPDEGDWLKPDITLDARADEGNYTDGTTDVYFVPVEQISQTLPLLDQLVSTPKDTKYYYRVRGVSSVPLSTDLTRTLLGTWTTGISVLARPTGTADMVAQAISAAQIADGAVVAHTVLAENIVALNAKLGSVCGDTEDYKLVMSPGTGDTDPEGTFLMGSDGSGATPADASYFRRWRENGLWRLAMKLQSFFVDAIASKIVGRFQVLSTSTSSPDFDVDPSTGDIKASTSINIGNNSKDSTRLKIKESIGTGAITFTGTGVNDVNIITEGAVEGDFEIVVKSTKTGWINTETIATYDEPRAGVYGNGVYVLAMNSASATRLYTSTDGDTWTNAGTTPEPIWAITYGNGLYVCASTSGKLFTSTNLSTWTYRADIGTYIYGLVFGNGVFVAAEMNSKKVFTSTDGTTWTERATLSTALSSAAYVNSIFIIGGLSKIYTSSDGVAWAERSVGTVGTIRGIAFGNGLYAVAGQSGFYSSIDSINWILRQSVTQLQTLAFGSNLFVGQDINGKVYTSNNCIQWTERQDLGNTVYRALIYNNGMFVTGVDGGDIFTFTPQLFSWREITGSWSADLPLYANYTYEMTDFDITFQFVTESEHILNDLWEFSQGMQKALSIENSDGDEMLEMNNGIFKVNAVRWDSIIRPLTATVSANTTYTLPTGEAVYTCIIPKAFLVASSGGPYTLTLTTEVSGKTTVKVPIALTTDTITSEPLQFNVYIDSVGNVTSEYFAVEANNSYGAYICDSNGSLREFGSYNTNTGATGPQSNVFGSTSGTSVYRYNANVLFPRAFQYTPTVIGKSAAITTIIAAITTSQFTGTVYGVSDPTGLIFNWNGLGRWRI